VVYVTSGLVETLLRLAREREPDSVTIALSVTPAGEIPEADLDDAVPVFTHFFLPSTGASVNAVFGVNLGTPAGEVQGRFVSHPQGRLSVSQTDDLAEVVFVAVPPWDRDSFAAFDRAGSQYELDVLDVEPPEEAVGE
jgi:hypothetical protein